MPKQHFSPIRFSLFLLLTVCLNANSALADWTHWRGDNRDSKSTSNSGWDGKSWNVSKPIWQISVGEGSSSPIIVGDKVYLLGWKSGKDILSCRELSSGTEIWAQSYASPKYGRVSKGDKSLYSGISSTPEFDPKTGLIYSLSTDGELRAWDTNQKGKLVWRKNLYEEYKPGQRPHVGAQLRDYGYSTSPFAFNDWLLVEVGSKTSGNTIAFDKKSGKQVWGSENKDLAGHTGGHVFMKVNGKNCVAILTLRNLVVMSLEEQILGKTIATYKWTTDFANNIPTPAVFKNSVILTTAYNHFTTCRVDISESAAKKVWEMKRCSGVCSPIIHKGKVYFAWRGVHCIDFETGKLEWVGGKMNEAASVLVTGDDRLICWVKRGELLLVNSFQHAKKFQQLGAQKLLSRTDAWPHVAISKKFVLCRDRQGNVVCLKLGKG